MHLNRIDILRAIAILLVFLHHAQLCLYPEYRYRTYDATGILELNSAADGLFLLSPVAFGWLGVHLFLLISGFLIHLGNLQSTAQGKSFSASTFFSKRFWRIYPPYLLVLFFFCFAVHGGRYLTQPDKIWDLVSHMFMVHNLGDTTFGSINPSFWSLALEVQLYLIYPLLLLFRRRWGMARTFQMTLALGAVLLSIKFAVAPLLNGLVYSTSVLALWYVWCAGAFLAERYHAGKRIFSSTRVAAGWMVGLFLATTLSVLLQATTFLVVPLAVFAWLAFFEWFLYVPLSDRAVASIPFRALSTVGLCSYSIYLIHQPYLRALLNFFGNYGYAPAATIIKVTVVFTLMFLLSYALYVLVEQPVIAFGRRLRALRGASVPGSRV